MPLREQRRLDRLEALLEHGLGRPQPQQQRPVRGDVSGPVVVGHQHRPLLRQVAEAGPDSETSQPRRPAPGH